LRGCETVDVVDATAEGYDSDVIWDGLGLIPYSIAPHFQSAHVESARVDVMVEYFTRHQLPFVPLKDGDVLITATVGAVDDRP
jgi:dipeptidase E